MALKCVALTSFAASVQVIVFPLSDTAMVRLIVPMVRMSSTVTSVCYNVCLLVFIAA